MDQQVNNILEEKLKNIKERVLLMKNSLADYRRQNKYLPVIGEGSHQAKIFFIGEAPGKNEALSGKPFCGSAGKILDNLLKSINLERQEVYITNILKDRPPSNRDPLQEEIEIYTPFLLEQLSLIRPKIIVTLGRYSARFVLDHFGLPEALSPISSLHGQIISVKEKYGEIKIVPLYHPAAAIYNQNLKETLLTDFQKLKSIL